MDRELQFTVRRRDLSIRRPGGRLQGRLRERTHGREQSRCCPWRVSYQTQGQRGSAVRPRPTAVCWRLHSATSARNYVGPPCGRPEIYAARTSRGSNSSCRPTSAAGRRPTSAASPPAAAAAAVNRRDRQTDGQRGRNAACPCRPVGSGGVRWVRIHPQISKM